MNQEQYAGYPALVGAIVIRATLDVRHGNGHSAEARAWLLETGYTWLTVWIGLDIEAEHWRRWVDAGCPDKRRNGS